MEGMQPWKEQFQVWRTQLEQFLHRGIEYSHQIPPTQLYISIAVLVVTTLLFLLSISLLKRTNPSTIVLAGLNGSGKTTLYYQLRDGSSHLGTVTSMEPNEGTFVLRFESSKNGKIKPVHIVDVPGHPRLRAKLDEFLHQAAGIIFLVDASDFSAKYSLASEYLYDILTDANVIKGKIPVLICCNKSDQMSARTEEYIRKQLEKEIDKLRKLRKAVSEADIANEFTLGTLDLKVPFAFSQCLNKVTTAEASALTGKFPQGEQFIRIYLKP